MVSNEYLRDLENSAAVSYEKGYKDGYKQGYEDAKKEVSKDGLNTTD